MARPRILAPEWVVAAFLAYCVVRLVALGALVGTETRWLVFPSGQILLSFLAALMIKTARRHRRRIEPRRLAAAIAQDVRIWWPLLALIACYPLVPLIIEKSPGFAGDGWLARLDSGLFFGHDPLLLAEQAIWWPLSELLAACYSVYGFLFVATAALLLLKENDGPARWLVLATTATLALGYVGYSLVPAVGPLYTTTFHVPIELRYMSELKNAVHDSRRIARDCFPSLHTAVTLILLEAARRWLRTAFWIMLPVAALIPPACVYLRYHYVSDVIAGGLLAAAAVIATDAVTARRAPGVRGGGRRR
jgi:membrane-associated phospholipid phosphatase